MKTADAVVRLESIQPQDTTKAMKETALLEAENVLLLCVNDKVRTAYLAVKERCS